MTCVVMYLRRTCGHRQQEAAGIAVLGTFRDLDAPDHVVWLRGFADMPARADGLGAFYGGPAWKAHRDSARARGSVSVGGDLLTCR
jgi:hypothetical protein